MSTTSTTMVLVLFVWKYVFGMKEQDFMRSKLPAREVLNLFRWEITDANVGFA